MPRASAESKAFTTNGTTRALLRPPPDLDALERETFVDIVLGVGPHHFLPADVPLVAILAKNIVLERVAFGELRAAGYIGADGKTSPWFVILQQATKVVTTISRALSMTPASRQLAAPERDAAPVSYYEKMNLLEGRRDEPESSEPN